MSHLGRWLSAQVDSELDGVERDRVLNHLAGCDACREEANAMRALKRRMTSLGDGVGDAGITSKLIELARASTEVVAGSAATTDWPHLSDPIGGSRLPWLNWRVASCSAGSALLAIGVLAFMLGGSTTGNPSPRVSPAVDAYWTQHSYDTGQAPATGRSLVQTARPSTSPVPAYQVGVVPARGSAGPAKRGSRLLGPASADLQPHPSVP
jgi:anti-sigma factor RsiW